MATYVKYATNLTASANFSIDLPLLNGSHIIGAQVNITRNNTPNIPVEIGISNLSQQISVYRLEEGEIWFGQLHNKVHWEGRVLIPKNEEYVVRVTGRNDSGGTIDVTVTVVDDTD